MRRQAVAEPAPTGRSAPRYQGGRAEGTGLPPSWADAVLAAQAFHWFEPGPTLSEFHRILKPDGFAVLLWNERDESDPFTQAYGAGVRKLNEAEIIEPFHGRGEELLSSPFFQDGLLRCFPNEQILDELGLMGRAFSVSYAPRDGESAKRYADEIRQTFRRFQQNGQIIMRYQTSVFLARRRVLVSPSTKS
jgi:SAM-dependent methyltransferase